MPRSGWKLFSIRRLDTQIVRGLLLFFSSYLFFHGIAHMPLATAASISLSSPIIVGDKVFVTCASGPGQERLHAASATHLAQVRRLLEAEFSEDELRTLAELLGRLPDAAGASASECSAA